MAQREAEKQTLPQSVPTLLFQAKQPRGNEHLYFSSGPWRQTKVLQDTLFPNHL